MRDRLSDSKRVGVNVDERVSEWLGVWVIG